MATIQVERISFPEQGVFSSPAQMASELVRMHNDYGFTGSLRIGLNMAQQMEWKLAITGTNGDAANNVEAFLGQMILLVGKVLTVYTADEFVTRFGTMP